MKKEDILKVINAFVKLQCENANVMDYLAELLLSSGTTHKSYMMSSRCSCCLALCFSTLRHGWR